MTKFKVGDIVVGNQDSEAHGVEQGQLYEVVATGLECGYDYIKTDHGSGWGVWSERFDLYKAASQVEQDDPLPPAPESVLYVESDSPVGTDAKLLVKGSKYGGLLFELYAERKVDGVHAYAGMRLDPDAALQLAHDLNRMANEIKRKEKQQERKTMLSPAIAHPYGE